MQARSSGFQQRLAASERAERVAAAQLAAAALRAAERAADNEQQQHGDEAASLSARLERAAHDALTQCRRADRLETRLAAAEASAASTAPPVAPVGGGVDAAAAALRARAARAATEAASAREALRRSRGEAVVLSDTASPDASPEQRPALRSARLARVAPSLRADALTEAAEAAAGVRAHCSTARRPRGARTARLAEGESRRGSSSPERSGEELPSTSGQHQAAAPDPSA
ncbi:hypothetical protein T492DRAFT_128122 [Pavlovales sp. CCMP2436]|nr:hypothetical protein T492DRAFT_128122 [Pavlovales sp. CCMP2436]